MTIRQAIIDAAAAGTNCENPLTEGQNDGGCSERGLATVVMRLALVSQSLSLAAWKG